MVVEVASSMLVVVEYFRVLKGKRPINQWDVELCAGYSGIFLSLLALLSFCWVGESWRVLRTVTSLCPSYTRQIQRTTNRMPPMPRWL